MFERVLILETSGKVGQAAIASGEAIVAQTRLGEERRRASDLASSVNRLLKEQGWRARELTAVIVGLGPGSYTGLRVGLASAKALAFAIGCQFFGIETYASIALRTPGEFNRISVVGDGLQSKLFHRRYVRSASGTLEPEGSLAIIPADEWIQSVHSGQSVTGPGVELVESRLPDGVRVASLEEREPRPIDLLRVAKQLPWAVTTDVWKAEPYYLRGSSAEEKAKEGSSVGREPATGSAARG